jgi:translation initiation factor 2B subunit (eIF-2B alpha/beta/delta family)
MEEVGYSSDTIRLVRSGRPLLVDDGSLHFRVHPFLFDFVNQAAESIEPKLNWENVEAKFIRPGYISQLETVPRLSCTLERVIMNEKQEEAVQQIVEDRDHGAAELAFLAVSALEDEAKRLIEETNEVKDGGTALEHLCNFGYHLGNCRPAMAPLANAVAHVLSETNDYLADSTGEGVHLAIDHLAVCESLLHAASKMREQLARSKGSVIRNAVSLFKDNMTIMTISKSSTLLETFLEALKQHVNYDLIISESRPLCEGVVVATRCADAGVRHVTLISEAQGALFMPKASVVMVGADCVTDSGAYNKVGTYLMALAAVQSGKPVYIISDTWKMSPGSLYSVLHDDEDEISNPLEENSGEELRRTWEGIPFSPAIRVRNFYFEKTPLDFITNIVSEDGLISPQEVPNRIRNIKKMYLAAFEPSI